MDRSPHRYLVRGVGVEHATPPRSRNGGLLRECRVRRLRADGGLRPDSPRLSRARGDGDRLCGNRPAWIAAATNIPWRQVAAPPRLRRGHFAETSRGAIAAATPRLRPATQVTVRLANDNKDAPAAEYDAAVQAAWTGCMVGCLCSVSGSILFTIVGIAGMAVLTGAVAAALTLLHARYWLAHRNVAAAGSRALVVSEVVEMLSPWRERKRGDVDFYTLQIVMATYVACNFMVNTSLQLASLYFKEVLDQPAWVVTVVPTGVETHRSSSGASRGDAAAATRIVRGRVVVTPRLRRGWSARQVLITAYITKAFSGRLTPVLFGSSRRVELKNGSDRRRGYDVDRPGRAGLTGPSRSSKHWRC